MFSGVCHRRFLGGLLLLGAASWLSGASTFVLSDSGGVPWRATPLQRPMSAGLILEQTFQRTDGAARIIVVSRPDPAGAVPSLVDFARLVQHSLAPNAAPDRREGAARRLGRDGYQLDFPLQSDAKAYQCELFVFHDATDSWGILCARLDDPAVAPKPLLDLLYEKTPPPAGVLELPTVRVRDDALCDFPLSFRIFADRATHRVARLVVTESPRQVFYAKGEKYDLAGCEIDVGDEILAIDGRPVTEFDSSIGHDSPLGRIFLNRKTGDVVHLDLISANKRDRYQATLKVPYFRHWVSD